MSSSRGRPSTKFGTVNYSADEMRRLNTKVRVVLPLVGEDWLRVAYQFNYLRPEAIPYRDVDSLKRKFKKMYCTRGKTLPDYVVEAKELRKLISQRLDKTENDTTETTEETESTEELRGLTLKLRQMEEQYHKRTETTDRVPSTSGVIAMLKQSVERKRRTVEESARVRRERKRRKMEEELLSIHQEQQRELDVTTGAARPNEMLQQVLSPLPAEASSLQDVPSLGVMELLLQFMTAQQVENTQRFEAEQARREQERREREERWRQKELQRQREHRELMFAMGALLGDRFPDCLKHYLIEKYCEHHSEVPTPALSAQVNHDASPIQDNNAGNGANNESSVQSPVQPAVSPSPVPTDQNDTVAGSFVKNVRADEST